MAEHKQTFAMDIISETVKQRNRWRLAFCISLAGNVLLAAMLIYRRAAAYMSAALSHIIERRCLLWQRNGKTAGEEY